MSRTCIVYCAVCAWLLASASHAPFAHAATASTSTGTYSPLTSPSEQCIIDIQRYILNVFAPYLDGFAGRIALVDVAINANLGDNILWLGARRLLHSFGKTPDVLCGQSKQGWPVFPFCPGPAEILNATAGYPLLLMWQPGGNWGELWPHIHLMRMQYIQTMDRLAKEQGREVTFIQLPQSIFYQKGSRAVGRDRGVINGIQNLKFVLLTRSQGSHQMAQELLGTNGVAPFEQVVPDIAFMVGPQTSIREPTVDLLLLVRDDRETTLPNRGLDMSKEFFARPENADITYIHTDWRYALPEWLHAQNSTVFPSHLYADMSDIRLQVAVNILNQGRVVVANRLHAVLVSNLMRKPNFWFEGKAAEGYGKVEQTMGLAYGVSPHCSEDVMHSYGSRSIDEAEGFEEAMTKAVQYVRKLRAAK